MIPLSKSGESVILSELSFSRWYASLFPSYLSRLLSLSWERLLSLIYQSIKTGEVHGEISFNMILKELQRRGWIVLVPIAIPLLKNPKLRQPDR